MCVNIFCAKGVRFFFNLYFVKFLKQILLIIIALSALTLLVGWQEGHPACKKQWWDVGDVVWDEVQTCT